MERFVVVDTFQVLFLYAHKFYDIIEGKGFGEKVYFDSIRSEFLKKMLKIAEKYRININDIYLAWDSKEKCWRNDVYEYYKKSRKDKKKSSDMDYELIYRFFSDFRKELTELGLMRNIYVPRCEADDIIGTTTLFLKKKLPDIPKIIVSRDHDFLQLQGNNVHIYNFWKNEYIGKEYKVHKSKKDENCVVWDVVDEKTAKKFLIHHILFGDAGDGVPNVKSDNDVFVNPTKRQKKFGSKTILNNIFSEDKEKNKKNFREIKKNYWNNLERNSKMVDMRRVPKEYKEKILQRFLKEKRRNINMNKDDVEEYCNLHRLNKFIWKFLKHSKRRRLF